jgi:hypothetical protein
MSRKPQPMPDHKPGPWAEPHYVNSGVQLGDTAKYYEQTIQVLARRSMAFERDPRAFEPLLSKQPNPICSTALRKRR